MKYNYKEMGIDIKKFSIDTNQKAVLEMDLNRLLKGTTFTLRADGIYPMEMKTSKCKLGAIYKDRGLQIEGDYNICNHILSTSAFYKYQNLALGATMELPVTNSKVVPQKVFFGLSYCDPKYELTAKVEPQNKNLHLLSYYKVDKNTSLGARVITNLDKMDLPLELVIKHDIGKGFVKTKMNSNLHLGLYTEQKVSNWMKLFISSDVFILYILID